jgi:hypothetical protein
MAAIYFIEDVKLSDLPAHFAKHRLRPVRLERWREQGWRLVTEKIKE